MIKFKVEMNADVEDIKTALKERGIAVNGANTKKLVKMIQQGGGFSLNSKFYDNLPKDKETLLMYGFTFKN